MRRHHLKQQRRIHERRRRTAGRRIGARQSNSASSGFTLIEMLVSVALVVIMMSMFATVFQLASGSILTRRGIAENDQRARSVVTVIRNDLRNRSFRLVTPFGAGEMAPLVGAADFDVRDFSKRRGFFYYSENDPNDDTDDVLHFTSDLLDPTQPSPLELDAVDDLYYGKATLLAAPVDFLNSNEPDGDDGNPSPNETSDSPAAEITIFMRGGRLYRRVLLLRQPLTDSLSDVQPTTIPGGTENYFDTDPDDDPMTAPPAYSYPTGNFWNDFDFSAHYSIDSGGNSDGAKFHGTDALNNDGTGGTFLLGNPQYRFGHNQVNGLPREYVGTVGGATNNQFIGRFTHEETSFGFFQYPQRLSEDSSSNLINDGNPMEQNPSSRQLNLVSGIVTDDTSVVFSGPRRAEDLLLANVHAFDIKIWDDALQQFVDIGHNRQDSMSNPIGDYNQNNNQNTAYGPNGPSGNRVFDTWRPDVDINDDGMGGYGDGNNDPPPYRPMDTSVTPNEPKPLRAIQITIRYYDVSSEQLRQVTQQISLTD